MHGTPALLLWTGVTVAAVAAGLRLRRPPVDLPAPAAVAFGGGLALVGGLVGLGLTAQAVVFTVSAAGMGALLWRWRVLVAENHLAPGVGGNRLVGRTATVITPPDPATGTGTVRLGAETWRATAAAADVDLATGDTVTVVGVQGIHIVVRPSDRTQAGETPCR